MNYYPTNDEIDEIGECLIRKYQCHSLFILSLIKAHTLSSVALGSLKQYLPSVSKILSKLTFTNALEQGIVAYLYNEKGMML